MSARLPFTTLTAIAWRNLWRNRERSAIMISALAIAVGAMIFLIAMMRGLMGDMQAETIRSLPGEIQLHHPQYRDDPAIEYHFPEPSGTLLDSLSQPHIKNWSGRIKIGAMISSERDNRGVEIIAYDPAREGNDAYGNIQRVEGEWFSSHEGIIVGARLLEKLETQLGKRIVLITQGADGETAEIGLKIIGVYRTQMAASEERLIYMPLAKAQQWLGLPGKVHQLSVYLTPEASLYETQQQLIEAAPQLDIKRWDQLNPYLSAMLESSDQMITVLIVIIFITLSFGLVNTLVMAIFERVREIGLMLALGLKPKQIATLILSEMLVLLLSGLALGNAIAGGSLYYLRDGIDLSQFAEGFAMIGATPSLQPLFQWSDIWLCDSIVITLGLLSSVLPAWKAAHYKPIEALYRD